MLVSKQSKTEVEDDNQDFDNIPSPVKLEAASPALESRTVVNFEERLLQASRVFLKAKCDGKKVMLYKHSSSLYHPVKSVNQF